MSQGFVNQREMAKHAASDDTGFNLRKLEGECALYVPLLGRRHRAVELSRLTIMIAKALWPDAQLLSCFARVLLRSKGAKAALRILTRAGGIEAIRLVRRHGLERRPADACHRVANSALDSADG